MSRNSSAHLVAGAQHLLDNRTDVGGDASPLEGLVGQRVVVEVLQLEATADLAVKAFQDDLASAEVVLVVVR
jgi:hypothetical protein